MVDLFLNLVYAYMPELILIPYLVVELNLVYASMPELIPYLVVEPI